MIQWLCKHWAVNECNIIKVAAIKGAIKHHQIFPLKYWNQKNNLSIYCPKIKAIYILFNNSKVILLKSSCVLYKCPFWLSKERASGKGNSCQRREERNLCAGRRKYLVTHSLLSSSVRYTEAFLIEHKSLMSNSVFHHCIITGMLLYGWAAHYDWLRKMISTGFSFIQNLPAFHLFRIVRNLYQHALGKRQIER